MYIVYINDAFQAVAEAGQTVHLNRSPSISYKPFNILTTAGKKASTTTPNPAQVLSYNWSLETLNNVPYFRTIFTTQIF